MSSNNNQNNSNNSGGNNNSNRRGTNGKSNQDGCNNSSDRGAGRNCNRNSNNNTPKEKGACESLDNNIFDCTLRKNIETCTKTLKQIIIYVGTEFGSYTEQIKYIVENFADPDLNKPTDITPTDRTDKLKMFC